MKVRLITILFAVLTAASDYAGAGTLMDVSVVNRTTGQRIPTHLHNGRLYIAGTPGEKYAVSIASRHGGRLMAVVSVDGVNAVTGETAAADQNGYVLAPWQGFEINGWRKSTSEIAAFYFTSLPDSYAARTDRPDNVGVIGVAVFQEWTPPRPALLPQPLGKSEAREAESGAADRSDAASAPPAAGANESSRPAYREEKIGTGHGEHEASVVRYTSFRRASSRPDETITIYYDTYPNLVARGVIPRSAPVGQPNPFPGGRFVPDPKG